MHIVASQIALAATSSVTRSSSESVDGRMWVGDRSTTADLVEVSAQGRANAMQVLANRAPESETPDLPELERPGGSTRPPSMDLADVTSRSKSANASDEIDEQALLGSPDGAKFVVLRRLLEAMTGKKVRLMRANDLAESPAVAAEAAPSGAAPADSAGATAQRVGWGYELEIQRTHTETTSLDFSARGTIVTEEGAAISFDASFIKQSAEVQVERISLRGGDAQLKDPLVLLYSGTHAELTQQAQAFDLDVDGRLDQLPSLANGAYVVHDLNRNHEVDDGRELLGALSGDGFADLRALDEDGNGFVDSADGSYRDLYLFDPNGAAERQLTSLAQAELLGLYTGSVATPFELKSGAGELQGRVRNTGIYLTEGGDVHPLEQIDLKV